MLTEGFSLINILRIGIDIALVWYVLYKLIMIIRGTKAIQLLKGIFVVVVVWVLSIVLNLHTIQWLTNQAILWVEEVFLQEVENQKKKKLMKQLNLLFHQLSIWLKEELVL